MVAGVAGAVAWAHQEGESRKVAVVGAAAAGAVGAVAGVAVVAGVAAVAGAVVVAGVGEAAAAGAEYLGEIELPMLLLIRLWYHYLSRSCHLEWLSCYEACLPSETVTATHARKRSNS